MGSSEPSGTAALRLAMRGVRKSFAGVPALVDANLEVAAGSITALVGENGAGKSTLMGVLAGALRPDGGVVLLDGAPFQPAGPRAARDAGVHLVHQELQLVDELSLAENVFLGVEPRRAFIRFDRQTAERRTAPLLAQLGVARHPATPLRELSLAERQLIEVARGLASEARLLALDEPTASLTGEEACRLFAVLVDLRDRGVGVIYISHRLAEVERLADRITVLRDGVTVDDGPVGAFDRPRILRAMVGRELDPAPSRRRRADRAADALLEVRGLKAPPRVRSVDLAVARGEIVGLFGLVGSGRSEFARSLLGEPAPSRGEVRWGGVPWRPRSPSHALRSGIADATEDRKAAGIVPDLSVADNITLAALPSFAGRGGVLRGAAVRRCVQDAWQRLHIRAHDPAQPIRSLSGGNQQKALLGRLLATDAELLILDEPTRGVDVGAKAEIHALLREVGDAGRGLLLVSSDLPELLALADRLVVFHAGATVGELDPATCTPEQVMALATTGRSVPVKTSAAAGDGDA